MHFFNVILAGTFAATAFAQGNIAFTSAPRNIQAGQTVTLKWSGGSDTAPVTITLREGPSDNLRTIDTITTTATGGSFQWSVPSTVADASDYAFQITQGTSTNYWGPIAIAGGTGTLSTSSSASASASSSRSAASASSSSASSRSASASSSSESSSSTNSASSTSSSGTSTTQSQTSSPASTAAAPSDTGNAAQNLRSNAALVLGAAAAMACVA